MNDTTKGAQMTKIREVTFVSPADPRQLTRPLGWQATCGRCEWMGTVYSVPSRNSARASRAMAYTEAREHDHDTHRCPTCNGVRTSADCARPCLYGSHARIRKGS